MKWLTYNVFSKSDIYFFNIQSKVKYSVQLLY